MRAAHLLWFWTVPHMCVQPTAIIQNIHTPRFSTCGFPPRSLLMPCKYCTALNRSSLLLVSPFHCKHNKMVSLYICKTFSYLVNFQAQIQDEDVTAIKAMLIQWNFFHSNVLLHAMKAQQTWCVFFWLHMTETSFSTNKLETQHNDQVYTYHIHLPSFQEFNSFEVGLEHFWFIIHHLTMLYWFIIQLKNQLQTLTCNVS